MPLNLPLVYTTNPKRDTVPHSRICIPQDNGRTLYSLIKVSHGMGGSVAALVVGVTTGGKGRRGVARSPTCDGSERINARGLAAMKAPVRWKPAKDSKRQHVKCKQAWWLICAHRDNSYMETTWSASRLTGEGNRCNESGRRL